MLRVPWSKVTSIGDKLLQVLRVLGVFQGSILRDTARTRSVSGTTTLNTACTRSILGFDTLKYCCTPSISGFNTLEHSLYLKYLEILYCSYFKFSEYLGSSYCKNFNTRSILGFHIYSKVRVILWVFQGFILQGTPGWIITRSVLLGWWSVPGLILAILGVLRVI